MLGTDFITELHPQAQRTKFIKKVIDKIKKINLLNGLSHG